MFTCGPEKSLNVCVCVAVAHCVFISSLSGHRQEMFPLLPQTGFQAAGGFANILYVVSGTTYKLK